MRYGSMRDLVLGLEVVLPNGELVSHLQPLHKNTTGYDLRHLFIGSEGTLGIITAATLKLFALPKTKATAWVGLDDIESAVSLLTAVQGHFAERLTSFELISRFALDLSSEFSQLKKPADAEWHILIELADSVPDAGLDENLPNFSIKTDGKIVSWRNPSKSAPTYGPCVKIFPLPNANSAPASNTTSPSLSPK